MSDIASTSMATDTPPQQQPGALVKPQNVIPASKYNRKIDPDKIFIPGTSIIDMLRIKDLNPSLVEIANTTASRRREKRNVDNEVSVLINGSFTKLDHVPGLKTTLYPHQQTAVKAMLDLEFCRTFGIQNASLGMVRSVTFNVAVLSEPVGSGKTIDILSVIILSKIPRAIPDIMELYMPKNDNSVGFIRRRFKKFLMPTIIFVGVSVMKQWQNAIEVFTELKVYSVNSIIELRPLLQMIVNGSINEYDVVLVKNGKITVPITMPDGITLEDKNKATQSYIYNIVANLRNYCWARVVIDDFDTIRLPNNAGVVNAFFTWYISSTRKKMDYKGASIQKHTSTSDLLKSFDYGCANIMYNHFMFHYLNVRNDIQFLKETTMVPNPKFHVAIFKNPNNIYISLLSGMGNDQVNRITEMLNGDAIGDAAEAAGIKSNSVADIFERILGGQFKQYRFSGDLLAFIEHLREEESARKSMSENPDKDDRYGKKDLLGFREVEYKYPGVNKLIDGTEEEYKEIKTESGKSIQRVKDNIKHGRCPVCRDELADSKDVAIAKCCCTVFCGNCGIEGQNLKDRYNKLNGRCSNCRATISIKDLIYMENFDLSKIEEEEFDDDPDTTAADAAKAVNDAGSTKTKKGPRTKYTAIVDIVKGIPIPESKRVDMHIPNMMKGGAFLPEPRIRKVLIFANYDETLKNVIKELEEEKIHYWRLMGSSSDIHEVSKAFTVCNTTCAMVINSTKHCSGLNLQTATDLVFSHNIIDPAIESQVAGRGHRLGRTSPLNIWFMQYENEYDQLVSTHGVRVMDANELKQEHSFEEGTTTTSISQIQDNTDDCYLDGKKAKRANMIHKDMLSSNIKDGKIVISTLHHRNEHHAPDVNEDSVHEVSDESNEDE
jgi:hypothetical protein